MVDSPNQQPVPSVIPQAPAEYDVASFNQILRSIEDNFRLAFSIGLLRGNGLYLVELPQSGAGLTVGEVFADSDGFLRLVQANETGDVDVR